MEELKTKRCSKCGCEKPMDEFYKSSKSPDGRQAWCKPCVTNAHRARAKRKAACKITPLDSHAHGNSTITADASPFAQMQPREIIAEIRTRINWLRSNGWAFEGKLIYTQVREVVL